MPDLKTILSATTPLTLSGVPAGFQPSLLADLARAAGRVVFIASDDAQMRAIAGTAPYFAPELEVIQIPAWDCLPYDRASPTLRIMAERIAGLHRLQARAKAPQLVLTTANAATQRVLTPFRIRQLVAKLAPGERIDLDRLAALLQANGYVRTETVHDQGEYAVRGGLVDLFPSGAEQALRLDFFGDEIESVRTFDPGDQRTTGRIEGFTLLPASEALLDEESIKRFRTRYRETFGATATGDPLYQAISDGRRLAGMEHWLPLFEDKLATLFDHLGDAVVVRDAGVAQAAEGRFEAVADYYENRKRAEGAQPGSYRPLPAKALYLAPKEWAPALEAATAHLTTPFHEPESRTVLDFGVDNARDFAPERANQANVYEAVVAHIAALRKQGRKPVLASYSVGARERLTSLLKDHGLKGAKAADGWQEALGIADTGKSFGVAMIVLPLDHGFTAPDVSVLTEQDMLGDRLVRRAKRRKSADAFLAELATLSPGDLVVHADHGIARYEGLTSVPVGKSPHDCVALSYAGGDKLYVPVENLEVLTRYGSGEDGATLDRLGGEAWQRRKSKMKERIREIAGELIATAAERALRPGELAEPDTAGYPSFVDRFPYEETDDQDRAIQDVLGDLAAGKPMDRLIVGDVGFGKTEVALRAAFVAAMAGMQVAVVCPTTLLARQHYNNFVQRFEGFPIKIGRLSRLVTAAESKKVKEGAASGDLDIVVGTHALLAKNVEFKRLGLVVVDEEQRFGVTHKERLKALKADVHMLTLTATPIPRTLQMAMSGLRELSVIQTPPVDRLAVRTYVMPWDPVVLREALLREHYRGGQSFLVTPRVADLPDLEEFLRNEVPEVRYVVAHGQMSATEVEERMSAFYDKKFEVLVSTTIIESGIDIASANTMIVNRADRFGLAQLYQLRGRVGRAKTRAYAYLVTPPERQMTDAAEKRLKVLSDLDSLGAGFQLASHDLDIRGAGNLLGDEQSGHIKEVGYELYQSMLEEAILEAKSGGAFERPRDFSPQITVDAPILIPDDYVPDLDLRMGLYRRLNDLEKHAEIESFAAEMIDRFGPLPDATDNLIQVIKIKLNAKKACVSKMDVGPKGVLVSFHDNKPADVDGLFAYVDRLKDVAKLRPDGKLVVNRAWPDAKARLHGALQLSKGLAKAAG
ncbi:transcription-repair coupling factor [Sphingomonas carotinifaciens]|uniref:Transcription-repair-coupling factor n=1 Tax=Sphingomonas carotinifaciens TaxID=1166323 RepID=A0A1G7I9Q6_9SPHN|nr:transcription-repair coupling factor [Sphingomonas carotinifaciens]MBB4084953.1 transcription-repair coupling factor (superfamily II helicase) [Sphingomonas carotinifaciens]MWC44336.1 transcription-repair coupling factor [Sphingomonas carotinifaciens]SDF09461.1 transcription-repair coupling factor [Sphingomonas carotinifaciens]